ncbi:MFS transporter [Paenarthrobacter sp. Z7-10]|uniref:MFS transporter n=1 Tax=Paenarthrobacter sp. Z7-10 TaxID=2787635 RepID=UPI0022A8E36B|nr:MFS transporter [Paenarthrobacter sp. Z7-10]MCZ2404635.1 MFS transporter [Paenarthrobacter sp. Z7-10]
MPSTPSTTRSDRLPIAALLILAAIGFTAITTELLPSGLLPQISAGFNVSEPVAGYLTAGYAAVIVVTVIPASILLARVPRNALLVSLIVTFALSNALIAVVPSFGPAMGARLVGGIAHGVLWSTMAPFVARIVPAYKMGRAMAVVFAGNSLGLAVGAPVGTALGALLGWRMSFLMLSGVSILLAVLALWLLPRVRRIPDAKHPSLRLAIAQPGVKPVAIAWPLLLMAHFALFTYIAPFSRAAGLPGYAVTLSLTVLGVAGLVGIWIAGITVDSRPRRSLITTTAAIAAAFVLLPFAGLSMTGAMILLSVWGAGLGAIGIYNQAAILRAGREHRDAANGLTVLTIQIGIAVGALYGAGALTAVGPLLLPLAAAVPAFAAFAIVLAGRSHAYPRGPKELRKGRNVPASDGVLVNAGGASDRQH